MRQRPLYQHIWSELSKTKPMVFLAGPRQSGKTTLSRLIASRVTNKIYFNWDTTFQKNLLVENPTFFEEIQRKDKSHPLVVLDEIHKYHKWKNYLKGIYDGYSDQYQFLVLGSGRLNVFQKGGDSLAGRYFLFMMWPFTLAEISNRRRSFKDFEKKPLEVNQYRLELEKTWQQLWNLSGFPEPFLSGKKTVYNRWVRIYQQQLIREDIRNMTDVKNIDTLEILYSLLPSKVGSPLSMEALGRDLQVSPKSIKSWIENFERFYMVFRINPWSKKISRSIKKEKKLYLYNYALLSSPAARFENMVAVELMRAVSNWNDLGWGNFGLSYVRNKEKEEVDFLITRENTPFLLIEAKLSDDQPSKNLYKFQSQLHVPAVQLVHQPRVYKTYKNDKDPLLIASATQWLSTLP